MKEIRDEIFRGDTAWIGNFLFPRTVLLHSMLSNCGYETRRTPDYDFDGQKRGQVEFAIFQYTVGGEGSLDYEGTTYKMHSGDAMMLHIPHRHRYFLARGTPFWRHCFLTIVGSDAVRLLRDAEKSCGPVVNLPCDSEPVIRLIRIIELARGGQLKSACAASGLVYDFVMSLHDFLSADRPEENRLNRQLIRRVHLFCLKHLADDIDVCAMAREAGCSRAHFSRLFKQLYGTPPARFLNELRLSSAIRLLQQEFSSIKEISARCGFRDESYFCKVFRKYHGVSPEKFRRGGSGK